MRNRRIIGKTFSQMLQLRRNIEKGFNCAMITKNPNKIKKDFKYITGIELELTLQKNTKDIYKATLKFKK